MHHATFALSLLVLAVPAVVRAQPEARVEDAERTRITELVTQVAARATEQASRASPMSGVIGSEPAVALFDTEQGRLTISWRDGRGVLSLYLGPNLTDGAHDALVAVGALPDAPVTERPALAPRSQTWVGCVELARGELTLRCAASGGVDGSLRPVEEIAPRERAAMLGALMSSLPVRAGETYVIARGLGDDGRLRLDVRVLAPDARTEEPQPARGRAGGDAARARTARRDSVVARVDVELDARLALAAVSVEPRPRARGVMRCVPQPPYRGCCMPPPPDCEYEEVSVQ